MFGRFPRTHFPTIEDWHHCKCTIHISSLWGTLLGVYKAILPNAVVKHPHLQKMREKENQNSSYVAWDLIRKWLSGRFLLRMTDNTTQCLAEHRQKKSLKHSLVLLLKAQNLKSSFFNLTNIHNVKGSSILSLIIYILKLFSVLQGMFSSF